MNEEIYLNFLQPDYHLLWYRIKRVLGRGSFGITYLAHDVNLDRLVAIKEYLPGHLSMRGTNNTVLPLSIEYEEDFKFGLSRFISEGRTLTRFEHPNLVRVFNAFEFNNTAYMVMNYEVGASLPDFINRSKPLSESGITQIILPLMDGLQKIHAQGFIHRDIKPSNIFIRDFDRSPVLLDFGSARQIRQASVHSLTNLVSPGYAPIEQYMSKSEKQGPWTDIYGLGATIYKVITGTAPSNAIDRGEAIVNDDRDIYIPLTQLAPAGYSREFLAAVDHALVFKADNRPQSITEWMMEFPMIRLDEITSEVKRDSDALERTVQINTGNAPCKEEGTNHDQKVPPRWFFTLWVTKKRLLMLATTATLVIISVSFISLRERQEREPVTVAETRNMSSASAGEVARLPDTATNQSTLPHTETNQSTLPDKAINQSTTTDEHPQVLEKAVDGGDEIQHLLAQADTSIRELRLTTPSGNNAYEQYQQILALYPDNERANAGIHTISDKYIALAYDAIKSNKIDRARLYINKASKIWPKSQKINPVKESLQTKLYEMSSQERVSTNADHLAPVEEHSGKYVK